MNAEYLLGKHSPLRHQALTFFSRCPNETGRDLLSGINIGMLRGLGLIVAHPDASREDPLVDIAFTLTADGERALELWNERHGSLPEESLDIKGP